LLQRGVRVVCIGKLQTDAADDDTESPQQSNAL